MNYRQIDVPISDIGDDDTFHISTDTGSQDISASIQTIGLINSPLCCRKEKFFQIVSGFRRISACKHLGFSTVPIRVLPAKYGDLELSKIAICDNLLQRKLNIVELSRSFNLLSRFFPEKEVLAKETGKLGLPYNLGFINKTIPICRLSASIQEGVLNETIALSTALELESMPDKDAAELASVLNCLKLSLNKQREVLIWTKEIAARDGISIKSVLNDPPIASVLSSPELDRNQKTQKLRFMLRLKRFPRLNEVEHRYNQLVKDLKMPSGIQLIAPKYFEGTEFTLQIRFKNSEELNTYLKFSQKLSDFHPEHLLSF